MTEITDYDSVKDKISVGLISADKVQEGIAARYFADLAMILYYQIEELEDHSDVNAILTTDLVKIWQKQEKELFVDAMSNAQKVYPAMLTWNFLLSPMEYLTRDMFLTDTGTGIFVAREKFENGAIVALYPGFLKTITEKLNTGMLYLFFTSKDEFVVHDARIISPTDILVVGRSVIRDATSESDFLSGQVFQYIADTDEIQMIVLEGTRKIVVSSMRIADLTLTR